MSADRAIPSTIVSAADQSLTQRFDIHRTGATLIHGFGYAGANAGALKPLAAHIPEGFGFAEFVMPGRGRRWRQPPNDDLESLCTEAVASLLRNGGAPILLGYSFGALVAFETARRMQSVGHPPRALVVCALNAPHRPSTQGQVHLLPLHGLRDHLGRLGGTPREVLDDLNVLACFEPAIRGDYRLIETYRYTAAEPLRCPIIAMAGTRDTQTSVEDVEAWSTLTTGRFTTHWIDEGHFFLHDHAAAWRQCLEEAAFSAFTAADLP